MSDKAKGGFDLAHEIRNNKIDSLGSKLRLVLMLSWPAILAQLSTILMEYIDAAMVGRLGAAPAASIGLVATTTWLFWGIGTASVSGFAVQVAHLVGAGRDSEARHVFRQSLVVITVLGCLLAGIGVLISPHLPHWLGGGESIVEDSTAYFAIFSISLPFMYLTFLVNSMLRCSGNMVIPGMVNVVMCILDVVFNALFIFPSHDVTIVSLHLHLPGFGLGVTGAALGSLGAVIVAGSWAFVYIFGFSSKLSHPYRNIKSKFHLTGTTLRKAFTISWPLGVERCVMCGAQILITAIVAPLGNAAIAANSFAVTAESLCYMPGYGLSDAATTLVGQSLGAGRKALARSFAKVTIVSGMLVMGVLGGVMWLLAPEMMSFFTPDQSVVSLGVTALRTEAWAEAMFGAAIVTYGAFVGAGYTVTPAAINFTSIWAVRLTLSALLAESLGLFGVWLAMAIELTCRGIAFIAVFIRGKWLDRALNISDQVPEVERLEVREPDEFEL